MNLLFTNSGRRNYLIEYALQIKDERLPELNIFTCDTTPISASALVDSNTTFFATPRVSDDPLHYAEELLKNCIKNRIDILIPLMDFELQILSEQRNKFLSHGISVIVSSPEVINTTLNKQLCHKFCQEHGLLMPKTRNARENSVGLHTPLILKRSLGSGSVDLTRIDNLDQVPKYVPDEFVLQEFIKGQEYGMDILNDLNGNFVHCCSRKKLLMRAGETDKAEVVYNHLFNDIGKTVSQIFRHVGNMDIDFIISEDEKIYFLDFNPRFGGGYPFTHAAGFDYLLAIIEMKLGKNPILPSQGKRIIGTKGIKIFTREM